MFAACFFCAAARAVTSAGTAFAQQCLHGANEAPEQAVGRAVEPPDDAPVDHPDAPVAPNPTSTEFVGRYYIGMNINSAGAATFEYGIAQTVSAVVVNVSPSERLGAADPESGFNPDGTITLVISADKVGGPGPGDLIGALVARSYPVAQDVTLRGDSASDVASLGNTYALTGNASCGGTATCLEDDAAQLAYSSGWHQVADADASGGHFRVNPNKNGSGSLRLAFDVAAGRTGARSGG